MNLIDTIIQDEEEEDDEQEKELIKIRGMLDQEIQNEKKNEESKEQQGSNSQSKDEIKNTMDFMIEQEKLRKQEKKKIVLKQLKKILNFLS